MISDAHLGREKKHRISCYRLHISLPPHPFFRGVCMCVCARWELMRVRAYAIYRQLNRINRFRLAYNFFLHSLSFSSLSKSSNYFCKISFFFFFLWRCASQKTLSRAINFICDNWLILIESFFEACYVDTNVSRFI